MAHIGDWLTERSSSTGPSGQTLPWWCNWAWSSQARP